MNVSKDIGNIIDANIINIWRKDLYVAFLFYLDSIMDIWVATFLGPLNFYLFLISLTNTFNIIVIKTKKNTLIFWFVFLYY